MNPHDVLKFGHLTVLGTIGSFPAAELYAPGAVGYWSVKDVTAHLSSFELVLVEVLGNILEPGPTPLLDEFKGDGGEFNDQQVDVLRKHMSMEQVMQEYTSAYEKVVALAVQIPEDTWRQQGILPWYGQEYDLEDFIVYTFYAHKREHCGQVQVFQGRLKEAGLPQKG